jgi:hypothetical protein
MEEFVNKEFFLIAVETIMQETAKGLPIRKVKLGFDGLKPASNNFIEMLFGDSNPHS